MEQKKAINRVITVVKEPEANKYLPVPLHIGEKVLLLNFQPNRSFVQIRHNKGKTYSVFHKSYFNFKS